MLLVEDNAAERWLYTEILRTRGHTVTACGDADQGWECYSTGSYPLILLDLQLPGGVDGLSLCRRIREQEAGERAIILVVTGRDEAETLAITERRVAFLEQQIEAMDETVRRLHDAQEFEAQLRSGRKQAITDGE